MPGLNSLNVNNDLGFTKLINGQRIIKPEWSDNYNQYCINNFIENKYNTTFISKSNESTTVQTKASVDSKNSEDTEIAVPSEATSDWNWKKIVIIIVGLAFTLKELIEYFDAKK